MSVRPSGARTAVRKGKVAKATSIPDGVERSPERPDAEFGRGRRLGLGRGQVGFLREVNRQSGIFSSCGLEP